MPLTHTLELAVTRVSEVFYRLAGAKGVQKNIKQNTEETSQGMLRGGPKTGFIKDV